VRGDGALLSPLEDSARLDFKVERGFGCGEPMTFQDETPFLVLPNTQECLILRYVVEKRCKLLIKVLNRKNVCSWRKMGFGGPFRIGPQDF
jgi:hypothetical protein